VLNRRARAHVLTNARHQWAVREMATSPSRSPRWHGLADWPAAVRATGRPSPPANRASRQLAGASFGRVIRGNARRTPTLLKGAKPRVPPTFSSLSLLPTFHLPTADDSSLGTCRERDTRRLLTIFPP